MDIPVNAAKPGRRRYLTLVMIFITVVICYVDRANLAVASAHIQEEFGITKAEMGYVFSAFAWLYTLCQIPGGWFLDRVGSRVTYFIAIFGWSVATLFQGFATGLMSLIGLRAITGIFEAPAFPTNNRMVTSWFPEHERASAVGFYTSGQFVGLAFLTPLLIWIQEMLSWHWVFIVTGGIGIIWSLIWFKVYQPPRLTKGISKAELDYIRDGGGLVDGDAPLSGTETTLPAPPRGVVQRRLTFTHHRAYPGLVNVPRHWVRCNPQGTQIAFLMRDDNGIVQLWLISPQGGEPRKLTHNKTDIQSAFNWHPSGEWLGFVLDNRIVCAHAQSGEVEYLTENHANPPSADAVVFSPDGQWLAWMEGGQLWITETDR